ncbi:MAG: cation:proton antiporter [Acidobacteria bacterium]|nr:cation:proton antiporter [Acidobacteriota bacterium]
MDLQPSALTLAIALAAGAVAQSLASQVRLPGIVLLLAAGAALGPEVAGWVDPSALGGGLVHLVEFGVAVVLFQGGLNLDLEHLRRQESAIWRLVSAGALGTLAGAAILARFVLEWEWRTAVLFGSVVVVTGQTVVGPLLHGIGLRRRPRTLLEAEAVLLDPIGALLATLVLQAVTVPAVGALASEAVAVAGSIAFGLLAGIVVGLVLAGAVRARIAVAAGYESVVVLTAVVLAYELCDLLVPQSGLTAVVVAGVVFANTCPLADSGLRTFTNPLTVVLVGPLVLLLAADVSLSDVRALGTEGLAVVAGLVLIVRPLGVLAATAGLGLDGRERAFLAWLAPRGLVAAVVVSMVASTLDAGGGGEGGPLRALVFLTIAGTVVLAGLTARPAAWALGLLGAERDHAAPPRDEAPAPRDEGPASRHEAAPRRDEEPAWRDESGPPPPITPGRAGPTELGPPDLLPDEAAARWRDVGEPEVPPPESELRPGQDEPVDGPPAGEARPSGSEPRLVHEEPADPGRRRASATVDDRPAGEAPPPESEPRPRHDEPVDGPPGGEARSSEPEPRPGQDEPVDGPPEGGASDGLRQRNSS